MLPPVKGWESRPLREQVDMSMACADAPESRRSRREGVGSFRSREAVEMHAGPVLRSWRRKSLI